jgi:hypothetical protein
MYHQVGSMIQRSLEIRGTKGVVNRQDTVSCFRHGGNVGNIGNFQSRICRRFQPKKFSLFLERNVAGHIAKVDLNTIGWLHNAAKVSLCSTVDIVHTENVILMIQQMNYG